MAVGTTIRFYDSDIDAWRVTWINPHKGVVQSFIARQAGDEIVLEGTSTGGHAERWIFSEITPTSFRWRAVESHDAQQTWTMTEEMRIRRVVH